MAIWPFSKKQRQSEALPEDLQEYYDAAQKPQTGMAWLLALGTLLLTLVLALILFFGGRWVYQKLAGDDNDTTQPEQTAQQENQESQTQSDDSQSTDQPPTTAPDEQDTSSTSTDEPSEADETPTTGGIGTEIPNTGPGPEGLQ